MANKQQNIISAIIREIFKRRYPEELKSDVYDFLSDGNLTEEKEMAIERQWEEMEPRKATLTDYKMLAQTRRRMNAKGAPVYGRFALRFAAVVAVLISLVGGAIYYFGGESEGVRVIMAEVVVPNAQQKEVDLVDGSKVIVNSGSKITYSEMTGEIRERIVELEGESYFDVAKSGERSFIVETKMLKVLVLGTRFNVEAYADRNVTLVTLYSGKIDVTTIANQTLLLAPGQQLIYTHSTGKAEVVNLEELSIEETEGWRSGLLVFNKLNVKEIMDVLQRKFGIEIETNGIDQIPGQYYAKFESSVEVEDVMKVLQTIIPNIVYTFDGRKLIVNKIE